MADLIDRQAAIEKAFEDMEAFRAAQFQEWLDELSPVDAVEVVRCKDCIRCGFCGEATNLEVMGFYGYCYRGKRREENAAD